MNPEPQNANANLLEVDEQLCRSRVLPRRSKGERPFLVAVLHFVIFDCSHSPSL
jgi:hypothetical protein